MTIGLLNEKPLHAALKQWYARPGDRFEVPVDGYVIDIVRGEQLIEIQTGNFSAIKTKLARLVATHPVRLIHPIVREKWIMRPAGPRQRRIVRRKSPRQGRLEDIFQQLVSIPHLITNGSFSLEVLIIRQEEVWRYGGKRSGRRYWRRRGWVVEERRLLEVLDQRLFRDPADWRSLLPAGLESFTTADLASALNFRRALAQRMAYCLHKSQLIECIGTQERSRLYRVAVPA